MDLNDMYSMPNIFSQDKLIGFLRNPRYKGIIEICDDNLVVSVIDTDDDQCIERILVRELNTIYDYTEHMAANFRRSELAGEIEAYKGVNLTSGKLDLMYCTAGLTSETAEVNKLAIRHFYFDKPINRVEMLSEVGDCGWYKFNILKLLGFAVIDVLKANIIKLKVRYPDKNKNIKLELKNEMTENEHINQYMISRGIE